jgi:hypothetical protein
MERRMPESGPNRTKKCLLVVADEIGAEKCDLSISLHKEIEHEELGYEKPNVIVGNYGSGIKLVHGELRKMPRG